MKILTFDCEVAPMLANIWRQKTYYVGASMVVNDWYILSWAARWYGEEEILSDTLYNYGNKVENQKHVAASLYELLNQADATITYNGDKYDHKVINTVFAQNGMAPPWPSKSIDLIKVVRKHFTMPRGNSLKEVCSFFGLAEQKGDIDGEVWKDCIRGDHDAWEKMLEYNKQDIATTEGLYEFLLPWIHNHPNQAQYQDGEVTCCTNCGSENVHSPSGSVHLKVGSYKRFECKDCGNKMRGKTMINKKSERDAMLVGV